jgi:O-antigen biosynthesis protein WbqP
MKRLCDFIFALFLILVLSSLFFLIAILVITTSKGPVIYWSDRIGKDSKIYRMPKFRSMKVNTPSLATHLLDNPDHYLTPIGTFLRKTSFDELPQIFSVLKGDMSFVGPRPALFNQKDLIYLRKEKGIDKILPGITGWAQINGRDELSISKKVVLDEEYLNRMSFLFDLKILWITFLNVLRVEGVRH